MGQISERISVREKIGYGLGDASSHIVFDSSVAILAYFYTNIYGLSPAIMGTMFLAVRLLDAITDPIMGAIADSTKTKYGRFRPYLLIICVPFAVSTLLVYSTPDYHETGKIIYAVITYILMTLMYTAINIPYCSLGAAITADPKENLSLQSYRFAITPIGSALGTALILPLADWLYPADRAAGIRSAMIIFGFIGCLMFLICFLTTKERVQPIQEENLNIRRDLKVLVKNDQWLILSLYNFSMLTGLVIRAGLLIYFIDYILKQGSDIVSVFMFLGTVASMFGSIIAKPMGDKFCKIKASFWINIFCGLSGLLFFFTPVEYWIVPLCLYLFLQILQGANGPLQWSMISDANNYGEWKTRRRITGMNVAANVFIIKLGVAVGGAFTGWGLSYFGFVSGVEVQSPQAIRGVLILFTGLPAIFYVLTAICIRKYQLTEKKVTHIVAQLEKGEFQSEEELALSAGEEMKI
jgi:GPH family glycoside/pentoside/hexuronide:cation symporter